VAAGVGILTLLWSALGWFQVIDYNVNQIWGVDKPRSFVKGKLFALAMVAAIGGVAVVSWAATAAVGVLYTHTDLIPGSAQLWQAAVSLLSVLTIAGAFMVLYRFTPRRHIEVADVWPAALATALLWELTRRLVAFYLAQNDMISGYGPIGAAMALLFWVYVSSIIILLGAELAYAIAKERRSIVPGEEMVVVAAPGEQPTPKFAPQVGRGFENPDQREPIVGVRAIDGQLRNGDSKDSVQLRAAGASGAVSNGKGRPEASRQSGSMTELPAGRGPVKQVLWVALTAATMALGGLVARRASSGIWEALLHEPPPSDKV